tara:strand:+ start:176 stop:589 length:414 start_codon:yes stop_codon:yes gene_type:complete
MKTSSDKKIKIYNIVNIIHDFENDQIQKLSIDLSLYFANKKIFWIFKENYLPKKNITEFIINISKENNYLNIIILKKDQNPKVLKFIKEVMKNFGKKIIIITTSNKKNLSDESIFYCKVNNLETDIKKKIINVINQI